jgi:hypothetical protein
MMCCYCTTTLHGTADRWKEDKKRKNSKQRQTSLRRPGPKRDDRTAHLRVMRFHKVLFLFDVHRAQITLFFELLIRDAGTRCLSPAILRQRICRALTLPCSPASLFLHGWTPTVCPTVVLREACVHCAACQNRGVQ